MPVLANISSLIQDAQGNGLVGVIVTATLSVPGIRIIDGTEIGPVLPAVTDSTGHYVIYLEATSNIAPLGLGPYATSPGVGAAKLIYWVLEEQLPLSAGGKRVWAVNPVNSSSYSLPAVLL